jgi:hypothetical protein
VSEQAFASQAAQVAAPLRFRGRRAKSNILIDQREQTSEDTRQKQAAGSSCHLTGGWRW